MAIDDIVNRIAEDAEGEASSLISAAEADAARAAAEAAGRADEATAATLERARERSRREASTIVANARLEARNSLLAARIAMDAEVLDRAEVALAALPDGDYAALLAGAVAATARGGETLLLGSSDAGRLRDTLPSALAAAGAPSLVIGEGDAGVERGVVLVGDRVRAEVSPAAMVAERRADLLALTDRVLFGTED